MKYVESILATSHVDLHSERLLPEAFGDIVEQANSRYIPMLINHDPRIPPQGRLISAELKRLDDGEYAVVGLTEVFEEGDEIELKDDDREMPLRTFNDDHLHLIYDRTYANPSDLAILKELQALSSAELEREEKKAFEPLSVFIVAVLAAAGAFATGFLSKMGSDTWDLFANKLKELYRRKRAEQPESLLIFRFLVKRKDHFLIIESILTNPDDSEIDSFFDHGLLQLDRLSLSIAGVDDNIRRLVFKYSNGKLDLLFGVRKDAVPVDPKLKT